MKEVKKAVSSLFEKKISPLFWMLNFLSIVAIRLFLDKFIAHSKAPIIEPIMDIHNILFFLLIFLLIWLVLSLVLREKPGKLAHLLTWANLLIIFPPVFDMIKTGGDTYWSFYLFSSPKDLWLQFITLFGNLPSGIVYFGTRIVFISAIVLLFGLILIRTGKIMKAALAGLGAYLAFFLMGSFPTLFVYAWDLISRGERVADVQPFQIAQFFSVSRIFGISVAGFKYSLAYDLNLIYFLVMVFLLMWLFYLDGKERFWAVIRNFRLPQIIYHGGLLIIGLGLGFLAYPNKLELGIFPVAAVLVLLVSVWLAWKASVIVNDLYDVKIDEISNSTRPLQKGLFDPKSYGEFGIICFILSILGGFIVGPQFGAMLIIYQILAWFYSAEPYRLKRFPIIATFTSSLASLNVLFLGFVLFSGSDNIQSLSWRIIALLIFSYTLCIPIKDFKDIEGDKKDGVWTIPVLLGEEKGRLVVGSGFFISFLSSVLFLNEFRLFWWALLFGAISFLTVTNKKIKTRQLFWWALGTASAYGLILVWIVFVKR